MRTNGLLGAVGETSAGDLRRFVASWVTRRTFDFWERLGIHVTPVHFYSPVPELRSLGDEVWDAESELVGVDVDEQRQLERLETYADAYADDYERLARTADETDGEFGFYVENGAFESVDAEVLYSTVRHHSPDRILEVGGGFSSRLIQRAIRDDGGDCSHTVIEPYPGDYLESQFAGEVIAEKVQDVPTSTFERLSADDVLFIDSSHVLKIGSDVQYEYLEVLPRLSEGVLVHAHDVFLPGEYKREWVVDEKRFWNEQYLLQAFLAFNDAFEVLWMGAYVDQEHPDALRDAFDTYSDAVRPGSVWLRKTR